jgi:hypothetical protein
MPTYRVSRPRGLTAYSFETGREWSAGEYTYNYRLLDGDGEEVAYFARSSQYRPYLMVKLSFSMGGTLLTPLHKLFAYNSPICNANGIHWSNAGDKHVHHAGRQRRGRNCREANMRVKTESGHLRLHGGQKCHSKSFLFFRSLLLLCQSIPR